MAAFDLNGALSQVFSVIPGFTGSSTDILTRLLEAGADLTLTTVDGTTPLMAAAGYCSRSARILSTIRGT